ncbi:MAG: tRNA glutamyl-Q(34) synthetase GluQRS [Rhodoferax sp.]|uniref:tRNA glutamyl-Q(34) synthetase GluQRS n=1 Tax=Rhodoferax sp. TaxID=50421 RepID=UPI001B6E152D|nr:tRNA glutamyl-Q(34) synthetase GluQRS [Rhodoferax sp.]MBP8287946.1 tRNA glutamyl-Q(34) synthetase GluQRS [Rhodoferax sp.]MBP9147338.1 tRNA glutamyl-Q(34) synthetase GluQRS [Rhodoferax sp.]MBP9736554.1 tRNA glutamyl-Q(34) synthetase GluQRS [Rhodoferax sp.]
MGRSYVGRFAPSPTGPLHAGSLVAALASWLDARAHGGQWLVRMEDVDRTRCLPGLDVFILRQLAECGLHSDQPPWYQSHRGGTYRAALDELVHRGLAYPCACSRKDIAAAQPRVSASRARHSELVYPGTCRNGPRHQAPWAWRLRTDIYLQNQPLAHTEQALQATTFVLEKPSNQDRSTTVNWLDRRLGAQQQNVSAEVGDFALQRADGCYTYQLAVVVDDAAQGITHVVRGEDLADNTARQILLQAALALPTPRYLHTPLVRASNGEKLSKQTGAQAVDTNTPGAARDAMVRAARALGLSEPDSADRERLSTWVAQWHERYVPGGR